MATWLPDQFSALGPARLDSKHSDQTEPKKEQGGGSSDSIKSRGVFAISCLSQMFFFSEVAHTTLCLHRVIVMQEQCYAVVLVMIILIGVIS